MEGRQDGGESEGVLSLDQTLELLSNYQRRAIIDHLRDTSRSAHTIDEVIEGLRRVEVDEHGESPGEDHLLSVLIHVHCPKLLDAGLIDYDVKSGQIRYYPNEFVEDLLRTIESTAESPDPG